MSTPPLYLLRHGQTDWNRDMRVQGQMESDLTELGRGHAVRQGEILAALDLPAGIAAYCSPQRRTRQTAELALGPLGITPAFDDRLKEIYLGHWEGHLYAEMKAKDPAAFEGLTPLELLLFGPGESEADMRARLGAFVKEITAPAIVVSHGIALTILRAEVLGGGMDEMEAMGREQGVVYELRDGEEIVHR
ncbi:histidine phosphatase family protein [Rhodalgimonas zhirmunskyi]|uniref:Histidine phosphatase family protein n=1 Tax=Rhodalgimonas zhirmunskyi TaxID=2964767 RepID=A0AAJ1UC62_9RHOB|nr:histidine phosphatase family protein [Rhodoalgimonas zhirmunskyi]MDQ2095188.1 histidine phosphatase family protein [Rhodoalgimonas zhirmunskyi]